MARADGGTAPAADGGAPSSGFPRPHPSNFVFDDSRPLPSWNVTIAQADLDKMNTTLINAAQASKEIYVPATLKVDDEDVGKVAIRYKGAYGTLLACVVNGMIVCPKMSYKIDFAEYEPDKRFHGLKKINLHGLRADATHLHEKLAYKLFQDMGIPAPRSSHGKVFLNGQYKGLYAVTEVVDGRFIDYWFPKGEADGNLYKEAWPLSTDAKYWVDRQKTNEPDPKDPMRVVVPPTKAVAASRAITGASAADLPRIVDSWMNLDYMMKLLAVDRATTNWDGPQTFYCGAATGGCGNHNFYLYESNTSDRLHLIPWDLDNTFQVYSWWEVVWPWNDPNPTCSMNTQVFTNWLGRPACDRIFKGLATAPGSKEKYAAAIQELLDKHYDVEKMRALLDQWAARIGPGVMMDMNGPGYAGWQSALMTYKRDLALLREKMLMIKAGMEPVPYGVAPGRAAGFEGLTPLTFTMGTSVGTTTRTSAEHALNMMGPLAGAADLRLTFELRNSTDDAAGAFYQRAYVRLNFNAPSADLRRMVQLKIKMKSDATRPVRIEFGSSKYKTTTGRIPRFGWETTATAAGGTVTLDAKMLGIAPGFMAAGDDLQMVLSAVNQIYVMAQPTNRDAQTGLMPVGASEKGWLQIDDVEVVVN